MPWLPLVRTSMRGASVPGITSRHVVWDWTLIQTLRSTSTTTEQRTWLEPNQTPKDIGLLSTNEKAILGSLLMGWTRGPDNL